MEPCPRLKPACTSPPSAHRVLLRSRDSAATLNVQQATETSGGPGPAPSEVEGSPTLRRQKAIDRSSFPAFMIASPRDTPSYGMGRHHSTMNICLRLIGCAETQPLKRNILPVSKTPSDRFLKYFLDSCLLLSAEKRTSQNSGKTVAELELSWHALLRRSTMDDQKRILLV